MGRTVTVEPLLWLKKSGHDVLEDAERGPVDVAEAEVRVEVFAQSAYLELDWLAVPGEGFEG